MTGASDNPSVVDPAEVCTAYLARCKSDRADRQVGKPSSLSLETQPPNVGSGYSMQS